jgi:hypothetical protein
MNCLDFFQACRAWRRAVRFATRIAVGGTTRAPKRPRKLARKFGTLFALRFVRGDAPP